MKPVAHRDIFKQIKRLLVLLELYEDEDQVLDRIGIFLIHRLYLRQQVLALARLAQFHQTESLNRVEERLLVILLQTYGENRTGFSIRNAQSFLEDYLR